MSTARHSVTRRLAAALAVLVPEMVLAAGVWTTGTWTSGFTPADDNIVLKQTPSRNGATPTDDDAVFTDGKASLNEQCLVNSGDVFTFSFDGVKLIREVRFYSCWRDGGRDELYVDSVVATTALGEAITLSPGAIKVDYVDDKTYSHYAYLKNADGSALASYVTSLKINFHSPQENRAAGYPEIEVIGEDDTSSGWVLIEGTPEEYGEPSPTYGLSQYAGAMDVSAPALVTNETETVCWHCTGWKLFRHDVPTGEWVFDSSVPNATGSGNAFHYEMLEGHGAWKIQWQWSPYYSVRATAEGAGTVSIAGDELFRKPGSSVTMTATPTDSEGKVLWLGDVPGACSTVSKTITFDIYAPCDLVAAFDLTEVADMTELNAALSGSKKRILLKAGTYQLDAEKTLSDDVILQGASDNFNDVLVYALNRRAFTLANEGARLRGVTLIGRSDLANGVVMVDAGTLENCRVTGGCVTRYSGWGAGVCNNGGTVRRCTIDGNTANGNIFNGLGLCQKAGLTEYCIITNNSYSAWHGKTEHPCPAGAYVSGGTMRGCLIAQNSPGQCTEMQSVSAEGFALHIASDAVVDGCAIVDNWITSSAGGLPTAAVYCESAAAKVVNCIIQNNLDASGKDVALANVKSGVSHSLLPSVTEGVGEGVVIESSGTYDWNDAGEFALKLTSAAVDAAAPLSDAVYDVDLYARSRVNNGTMDMGPAECTEVVVKTVSIKTDSTQITPPVASTFTVKPVGYSGDLTYAWSLDGQSLEESSATCTVSWAENDVGVHTVSVAVTDGTDERSADLAVTVLAKVIYLDASCKTPASPYATPQTAATNVQDVLPIFVSGGTLVVAPGTYDLPGEIRLAFPYTIRGTGTKEETVFRGGKKYRMVSIESEGCEIRNVTFDGGHDDFTGGTMQILQSATIVGCGIYGGTVTRGLGPYGGCLYMSGENTVVSNCTIGNVTTYEDITYGAGVCVKAGLLTHSFITNVISPTVHLSAGHASGRAVHVQGGIVRNCLIAHNRSGDDIEGEDRVSAAVYQTAGRIENCTITDNESGSFPGGYNRGAGGEIVNTIIWGNRNGDSEGLYGDADIGCGTDRTALDHCVTNNPKFKRASAHDYRLRSSSPAIDAGLKLDWMTDGATDLNDEPRIRNCAPDVGCYEGTASGLLLIVR